MSRILRLWAPYVQVQCQFRLTASLFFYRFILHSFKYLKLDLKTRLLQSPKPYPKERDFDYICHSKM